MYNVDKTCWKVLIEEHTLFSESNPPEKKVIVIVSAQIDTDRVQKYETTTRGGDMIKFGLLGIINRIKQNIIKEANEIRE